MHARIIDATGGSHGVRDVGLLASACGRPEATFDGKRLYPTAFMQAAALLESLARNHPFIDGNKRTAFTAAALFLWRNGYELTADQDAIVPFMVSVAEGACDTKAIAAWLKKYSKKS